MDPKSEPGRGGGVVLLGEKHMISIILYILEHDGAGRFEIRMEMHNNPAVPTKLEVLETAGLIINEFDPVTKTTRYHLSEAGLVVAASLTEIDRIIQESRQDS